jgi:hypothetical protein
VPVGSTGFTSTVLVTVFFFVGVVVGSADEVVPSSQGLFSVVISFP